MQLDDFWTDGDTGVAILPEPHPCGHTEREQGCGGCDPGAIEFVRDDDGPWRRVVSAEPDVTIFDPDLGERVPMVPRLGDSLTRRFGIDAWTNAPSNTLSAGVVPVNQIPARHLMHGPITIG